MTEAEYIDMKNLTAVENALNAVRSLQTDDAVITACRIKTVMENLIFFELELRQKIEISPDLENM